MIPDATANKKTTGKSQRGRGLCHHGKRRSHPNSSSASSSSSGANADTNSVTGICDCKGVMDGTLCA